MAAGVDLTFFSRAQIEEKVAELAARVAADYVDKRLVLAPILKVHRLTHRHWIPCTVTAGADMHACILILAPS
jgi:hypothetical protein